MVLTINPTSGEATASTPVEHTAEFGGSATLGNISSFGLDAAGELYVVNHTGGTIVRVLGRQFRVRRRTLELFGKLSG